MTPRRPLEIDTSAPKGPTKLASAGRVKIVSQGTPDPRITALQAENEKLRELLVNAQGLLTNSGAESGYCMCGDLVASHSIGSGHSPVDSHIYYATDLAERIQAALEPKP